MWHESGRTYASCERNVPIRFVQQRGETPAVVDEDVLHTCLKEYPLSLAVLFGSQADASAHELSDLDVAVRFDDAVSDARRVELLDTLTAALIRTSGFEAIDLVDLEAVPPALGYEICSKGTLLIGDEADATEAEATFLLRTLDFEPVTDEWHEALRSRLERGEYGRPR